MRKIKWRQYLKKRYLSILLLGALFVSLFHCSKINSNPFAKYDICFERDLPGASDRHVTYKPVSCSDPTLALGDEIGGEFATLTFSDVDENGTPEYIISSEFWCKWGLEPCLYPSRTVVQVEPDNPPRFKILEREILREFESDF